MQPVRITTVDRLLTSLAQARQAGRLKAGQAVIEIVPQHRWNDRAFAVQSGPGQYQVLSHVAVTEPLAPDYAAELRRHGFPLNFLFGVDYQGQVLISLN